MKIKLIFTIVALLFVGMFLDAKAQNKFSPEFMNNLKSCTPYYEESSLEFFSVVITPVVAVKGKINGKCVYENYMKEAPESKYVCAFTDSQLKEIETTYKKDPTKQETYTTQGFSFTGTPMDVLFTKFMNDPATCKAPENK